MNLYGEKNYKYNAIFLITFYMIGLFVLQINILATLIGNYFQRFNNMFNEFIDKQNYFNYNTIKINQLIGFVKCHKYISEQVFTINKIFGIQILVLDKFVTISIVNCMYLCLIAATKMQKTSKTVDSNLVAIFYTMWSLIFLVKTINIHS